MAAGASGTAPRRSPSTAPHGTTGAAGPADPSPTPAPAGQSERAPCG